MTTTAPPITVYVECLSGVIKFYHDAAATKPYEDDPHLPVPYACNCDITFQLTPNSDPDACFAQPPIDWRDAQPPSIHVPPMLSGSLSFSLTDDNTYPHPGAVEHPFNVMVETGGSFAKYISIHGADPTVVEQGEEGGIGGRG